MIFGSVLLFEVESNVSLLVGVSLIQVAISLKNICDVFVEAIADTSISQSTISRNQ